MKNKLQQNNFVVRFFMTAGHTVLFFNLLAVYQGERHHCTQSSTNFRRRRQPAIPSLSKFPVETILLV